MSDEKLSKEFKTKLININKLYVNQDYKAAYQGYMNLLIDNPGNVYILHNLGVACHHLKQYKEGAGYFIEALEDEGFANNFSAFLNGANTCVCAGDMVNAKKFIEKAYAIKPDDEKVSTLYKKILSCFVTKID
jgi:tetratricopeptide (TPR) repeat protein